MDPAGHGTAAVTRVALDLRIIHFARTGFHRFARGIIHALERFPQDDTQYVLLVHEDAEPLSACPHLRHVAVQTPLFVPDEGARLADELAPLALDVVHFPFSLFPGRVAPRVTVTVHDTTCLTWPDTMEARYRPYYRSAIEQVAAADAVVAVSHATAESLRTAGVTADVRVIYQETPFESSYGDGGVADATILQSLLDAPYVLAVGSFEPRKNHASLLAAFTSLRADRRVRLVLVGGHGWLSEALDAALAQHPFRHDICVLSHADDATVALLMRHCAVFVHTAYHEGFGLTPLEALALGACVVSTPVPSLIEAGFPDDGLIDPTDVQQLHDRLAELMDDATARRNLATHAQDNAGRFYRGLPRARLSKAYAA